MKSWMLGLFALLVPVAVFGETPRVEAGARPPVESASQGGFRQTVSDALARGGASDVADAVRIDGGNVDAPSNAPPAPARESFFVSRAAEDGTGPMLLGTAAPADDAQTEAEPVVASASVPSSSRNAAAPASPVPARNALPVRAGVDSSESPATGAIGVSGGANDGVRPPPAQMTVNPGQNHVVAIAYSHLNRIITPFSRPEIATTSLAETAVDGSIVYVSTNLEEPVALFIFEADEPENAISLTLVPREIPPVSTRISLRGHEPSRTPRRPVSSNHARAFEIENDYVDMITRLFRALAEESIPDGYGFEQINGWHPHMPECRMPGITVRALQVVEGHSIRAFVAEARNTSSAWVDVREDLCTGNDVRAVAAWPHFRLAPGEAVELFIATGVADEGGQAVRRPSVIGSR